MAIMIDISGKFPLKCILQQWLNAAIMKTMMMTNDQQRKYAKLQRLTCVWFLPVTSS